jgi:dTDP-4-amino-4,6-dideoxygalactose transaminase
MKNIPVAKPLIGRDDIRAVVKVMKSGGLAQGPQVLKFEQEFSKFVNDRECVAVNSGTSALHLALLALGIGPGDEVIVPSFTFAATANSVALTGATAIFVDIDPATYNIDPNLIEAAITPKTKAIQVVHLYGLPADMYRIS